MTKERTLKQEFEFLTLYCVQRNVELQRDIKAMRFFLTMLYVTIFLLALAVLLK